MAVSARNLDDDGALVTAVQHGDLEAFSELFRRHYPSVRRACARRLRDPHEADETAQAAFVRALERIATCDGERRFGRWVHVIARHLCVDAQRSRNRVEPREEPFEGRPERRPNDPEESLLTAERAAHVHAALGSLPERQRDAVIARDLDDLRPPEIADRLGLSVGAVDSLLLRARRRLAVAYRHVAGEGGGAATAITSAAASVGATMLVRPAGVVSGAVAAAHVVQGTATEVADTISTLPGARAAGGVVSAVVGAAMALTGTTASPPAGPVPDRPPAVVAPAPATAYETPAGGAAAGGGPVRAGANQGTDEPVTPTTLAAPPGHDEPAGATTARRRPAAGEGDAASTSPGPTTTTTTTVPPAGGDDEPAAVGPAGLPSPGPPVASPSPGTPSATGTPTDGPSPAADPPSPATPAERPAAAPEPPPPTPPTTGPARPATPATPAHAVPSDRER